MSCTQTFAQSTQFRYVHKALDNTVGIATVALIKILEEEGAVVDKFPVVSPSSKNAVV